MLQNNLLNRADKHFFFLRFARVKLARLHQKGNFTIPFNLIPNLRVFCAEQLDHLKVRWFNKSEEKTFFGRISKICGKNTMTNLSATLYKRCWMIGIFGGAEIRNQ